MMMRRTAGKEAEAGMMRKAGMARKARKEAGAEMKAMEKAGKVRLAAGTGIMEMGKRILHPLSSRQGQICL